MITSKYGETEISGSLPEILADVGVILSSVIRMMESEMDYSRSDAYSQVFKLVLRVPRVMEEVEETRNGN